jgi:hypothetical protein
MEPTLSREELARCTGDSLAQLQQWQNAGFLGEAGAQRFSPAEVERVFLLGLLHRRGVAAETIAARRVSHQEPMRIRRGQPDRRERFEDPVGQRRSARSPAGEREDEERVVQVLEGRRAVLATNAIRTLAAVRCAA